jgi:hypothetical protein
MDTNDPNPMDFDLSFLGEVSADIKKHLEMFVWRYVRLTNEQQTAVKKWLEALVELENNPPAPSFDPRIILGLVIQLDEHEEFVWRFPARLLLKAIKAMEHKIKFVIDDFEDTKGWQYP